MDKQDLIIVDAGLSNHRIMRTRFACILWVIAEGGVRFKCADKSAKRIMRDRICNNSVRITFGSEQSTIMGPSRSYGHSTSKLNEESELKELQNNTWANSIQASVLQIKDV